jgi:hypothetical protein
VEERAYWPLDASAPSTAMCVGLVFCVSGTRMMRMVLVNPAPARQPVTTTMGLPAFTMPRSHPSSMAAVIRLSMSSVQSGSRLAETQTHRHINATKQDHHLFKQKQIYFWPNQEKTSYGTKMCMHMIPCYQKRRVIFNKYVNHYV